MQHVWSQVELAMAMICVCASTYRPLFEGWKNTTAKIPKPCSIRSRASPRRRLRQGSEGQIYGLFDRPTGPNASRVDRHVTGNRGFSGRQIDRMWV
jgi:hypothetical protein